MWIDKKELQEKEAYRPSRKRRGNIRSGIQSKHTWTLNTMQTVERWVPIARTQARKILRVEERMERLGGERIPLYEKKKNVGSLIRMRNHKGGGMARSRRHLSYCDSLHKPARSLPNVALKRQSRISLDLVWACSLQ